MAQVLPEPLNRALAAYQTGDLAGAASLCQELLAKHDRNSALYFDGLHLLAAVQFRSGRLTEALASYDAALAIQPNFAAAHSNRANVLKAQKRLNEALESYDKALAIQPDFAEALSNRGNALMEMQRFEDALASYDRALAIRPNFPGALNNRANILKILKRFEEALAGYDSALAVQPNFVDALNNRGNALMEMKRFEEALASYDRALTIRPDNAPAIANRGKALSALRRFDEAVISYDKALAIKPDFIEALKNRAVARTALKNLEQASVNTEQSVTRPGGGAEVQSPQTVILPEVKAFEETFPTDNGSLAMQGDRAEALYNRARALTEHRRFDAALAHCEDALAARADFAEAFNLRGEILKELRRFPEALDSFRKAQKLRPDFVDAHRNEAQLYLLIGDFRTAWWKYDRQAKWGTAVPAQTRFSSPAWDGMGGLLCDRTILLHGDQAYSDAIQFSRYIPILAARGATVIVGVETPLRKLFAANAVVTKIVSDDAGAAFDFHCSFVDLPRAFGTTLTTIPATVPYLRAPPEATARWETLLAEKSRPRIGIVWSGDAPNAKERVSIELAAFLKVLDVDATLVCAQRTTSDSEAAALQARPDILTFGNMLSDFSEAAALLSCLDLLITVDSSMAHLAGALGIPVWVLLQYTPDWRWLVDRDDNPWYPTARLFRQSMRGDWKEALACVAVELLRFRRTERRTREAGATSQAAPINAL